MAEAGFTGHPYCRWCKTRFYNEDLQWQHMCVHSRPESCRHRISAATDPTSVAARVVVARSLFLHAIFYDASSRMPHAVTRWRSGYILTAHNEE
jgi:hypothetical protein